MVIVSLTQLAFFAYNGMEAGWRYFLTAELFDPELFDRNFLTHFLTRF